MFKKFPETPPPDHPSLPAQADVKRCAGDCGMELPKTASYFDRDNQTTDGFKKICKQCRSEQRRKKEDVDVAEAVKKIDRASLILLEKSARSGSDVPHMAELYQRLMEVFNGPSGFSQHFMAQYLAAEAGGSTRQKMLDAMIRMSQKVSESGAAQKSLEDLTDEDLANVAREQLIRLGTVIEEGGERHAEAG